MPLSQVRGSEISAPELSVLIAGKKPGLCDHLALLSSLYQWKSFRPGMEEITSAIIGIFSVSWRRGLKNICFCRNRALRWRQRCVKSIYIVWRKEKFIVGFGMDWRDISRAWFSLYQAKGDCRIELKFEITRIPNKIIFTFILKARLHILLQCETYNY